jgi:hypothetical protein
MPVPFTISEQDYVKSAQLNGELTKKAKIFHLIIDTLLFLAGVSSLLNGNIILGSAFIGVAIGAVTLPYLLKFFIIPFILKRHYKKYRQMQKQMNVELAADGLSFQTETGSALLTWPDIHAWRENNEYIIIYIAPKIYHVLPVRISENGFPISELKSALLSNVGIAT